MRPTRLPGVRGKGEGGLAILRHPLLSRSRHCFCSAFTLVMIAIGLLAVAIHPTPATFGAVCLYIACLAAWLHMTRRAEGRPQPDAADPCADILIQLDRTRADLRRTDAWMRLFPLGILLAALIKFTMFTDLGLSEFLPVLLELGRSGSRTVLAFLILLAVLVYSMRRSLRLTREMKRLELQIARGRAAAEAPPHGR